MDADKWNARFGTLYANKDVPDPPGSNEFRLPTGIHDLLKALEGSPMASKVGRKHNTPATLVSATCMLPDIYKHNDTGTWTATG